MGKPGNEDMNAAEMTNRVIIIGLLIVALVSTFTIYLLYRQGKQEVGQFILIVSNVTSGLIGYLGRDVSLKHTTTTGRKSSENPESESETTSETTTTGSG